MKHLLALVGSFALSHAQAGVFASYEDYYAEQPGVVFRHALEAPADGYSIQGARGLCGEDDLCRDLDGKLGAKTVKITISQTRAAFMINGRRFAYGDARTLHGAQRASRQAPLYDISAYVAPSLKNRPDLICIEGQYMGSGRFRNRQVFLLVEPFKAGGRARLFHLPSLHSSCMAVRQESSGAITYPSNSYFPSDDAGHSNGLIMKYFELKQGAQRPPAHETRLRFVEAGDPFTFTAE